jgi:O-antigen/teichoic acid export membrane protein
MADATRVGGRLMSAVRTMLVFDLVAAPLGLATRSLLTKTMSPADFGLYSVIYGLVVFLGSLAAPDIAFTTFIASARASGRREEVRSWASFGLTSGLAVGILAACALAVASPWLASRWLHTDLALGPLLVSSLGLATMTLSYNASGILAGLDRFGLSGGLQLARQAGFLALAAIALVFLGRGDLIYWALSVSAMTVAVAGVGLVTLSVRPYRAAERGSRDGLAARARTVWRYYGPLLGKGLGSQLTDKFGLFAIAAVLPLSMTGAYGAVMPLAALAVVSSRWTYGPLATHFAERHGQQDPEGSARLLWRSTGLSTVFSCLIALAAAILAPTLITVLYTPEYLVAVEAFVLLLLATAAGGLGGPAVRALLAASRTTTIAFISVSSGLVYVPLAYVAARTVGLVGVAAASVLVLSCQSIAYLLVATGGHAVRRRYLWMVAPFGMAVTMYVGTRLAFGTLGALQQAVLAGAASVAYLALLMATPLVSVSDIRYLLRTLLHPKSRGAVT